MKRKCIAILLSVTMGIFSFQGCIGSFGLTGKVYNFNKGLGDKWIQELGFLVMLIIQVYTIAFLIDVIVLNSIQFWTGTNPVAMQPGDREVQYVKGENGALYKIEATQNRFHIDQIDGANAGKSADIVYNPKTKTWYLGEENRMRKVVQFSGDSSQARVFKPSGEVVTLRTDAKPDEIYKALGLKM
jgi:hypothetical protein